MPFFSHETNGCPVGPHAEANTGTEPGCFSSCTTAADSTCKQNQCTKHEQQVQTIQAIQLPNHDVALSGHSCLSSTQGLLGMLAMLGALYTLWLPYGLTLYCMDKQICRWGAVNGSIVLFRHRHSSLHSRQRHCHCPILPTHAVRLGRSRQCTKWCPH